MLNKKKYIDKISFILSIISLGISAVFTFCYILLMVGSIFGIVLASLMVLASSVVATMILYNTTVTAPEVVAKDVVKGSNKYSPLLLVAKKVLFLGIIGSCVLLSSASIFISSYQSLMLLGGALVLPMHGILAIGVVAVLATIMAVGPLIYSVLQTEQVWQRMFGSVVAVVGGESAKLLELPNWPCKLSKMCDVATQTDYKLPLSSEVTADCGGSASLRMDKPAS